MLLDKVDRAAAQSVQNFSLALLRALVFWFSVLGSFRLILSIGLSNLVNTTMIGAERSQEAVEIRHSYNTF
jgi:hypothetical protein